MNKYKLIPEGSLYRLKALKDFADVRAGDLGGLVSGEHNLSQEGSCWVSGKARVFGEAWVFGDALVSGEAWIYGDALVSGEAEVSGKAKVSGKARVFEEAKVFGEARVFGGARVTCCLFIQQPRHNITVTDTHAFIGCQGHTWEYWALNLTKIGKTNGYSKEEVKRVKSLLKILKEQVDATAGT
jgi:hypothetical protein